MNVSELLERYLSEHIEESSSFSEVLRASVPELLRSRILYVVDKTADDFNEEDRELIQIQRSVFNEAMAMILSTDGNTANEAGNLKKAAVKAIYASWFLGLMVSSQEEKDEIRSERSRGGKRAGEKKKNEAEEFWHPQARKLADEFARAASANKKDKKAAAARYIRDNWKGAHTILPTADRTIERFLKKNVEPFKTAATKKSDAR